MAEPVTAYVGLGSNLDDPPQQLRGAARAMAGIPGCELTGCSRIYRSAPLDVEPQPDFLNAVCRLATRLEPRLLLEALLVIERAAGRVREHAGQARVLDLDLLVYDDVELAEPHLTVPHPRLAGRAFVLRPLADLDPDLVVPGAGPLRRLLAGVGEQVVEPLDLDWCPGQRA